MTAVVPDMDPTQPAKVDPVKLFETIDDFGPTNLFGSPALLRRVAPRAPSLARRSPRSSEWSPPGLRHRHECLPSLKGPPK